MSNCATKSSSAQFHIWSGVFRGLRGVPKFDLRRSWPLACSHNLCALCCGAGHRPAASSAADSRWRQIRKAAKPKFHGPCSPMTAHDITREKLQVENRFMILRCRGITIQLLTLRSRIAAMHELTARQKEIPASKPGSMKTHAAHRAEICGALDSFAQRGGGTFACAGTQGAIEMMPGSSRGIKIRDDTVRRGQR